MKTQAVSVTINNYFSESLVIFCAYFPCFVNKLDYMVDASAVITCIDNVLALNKNCGTSLVVTLILIALRLIITLVTLFLWMSSRIIISFVVTDMFLMVTIRMNMTNLVIILGLITFLFQLICKVLCKL